jgi:peptidoglycan hydrolase-like protein with peptidoglycan-binding domain
MGLSATLQMLIAQRNAQGGSSAGLRSVAGNLTKGSSGSDVTVLQQFLISQNKGSFARALAGVGATGNFGSMTLSALAEFQANTGISPASGNFGPITRAYISAHY